MTDPQQAPDAARIALVCGASRGLGRDVALAFGRRGWRVIAVARTVGGLEELDDDIQAAGGHPAVLTPLDIAEEEGVMRLGAALFERFGRVDALVHAAAQAAPLSPIAHVKPKDFSRAMAVNAGGAQAVMRSIEALLQASDDGRASFVVDETVGVKFWGSYGASKAAMRALAASFQAEHPRLVVRLFAPPPMPTALRKKTHPGEDASQLTPTREVAERLIDDLLSAPRPVR